MRTGMHDLKSADLTFIFVSPSDQYTFMQIIIVKPKRHLLATRKRTSVRSEHLKQKLIVMKMP